MTQSFSKQQANRFYHRVLLIRLIWAVTIAAFLAGMISLCLGLLGLSIPVSTLGGLLPGLAVGGVVIFGSRVKRESEDVAGCGSQCANCAAAGTDGCLSGFDRELEGRIAAYDAAKLGQLGFRMRGVIILPVLLLGLGVFVPSHAEGVVPVVFALAALVGSVIGLTLMRTRAVQPSA
ncbi:hypothetical protein [Ferrimicrobium acidiphilum]|uniref:hypothetical protein n=1 Tax=Ferrimicrobium acidiphilum TaxID=121039 RepID=UPI0023F1233E|nr:hypothetical protein [Ferrimicrobium acidiphilum]